MSQRQEDAFSALSVAADAFQGPPPQAIPLAAEFAAWNDQQLADCVSDLTISDEGGGFPVIRDANGEVVDWEGKLQMSWDRPDPRWIIAPLKAPRNADFGIFFPAGGSQNLPRLLAERLAKPSVWEPPHESLRTQSDALGPRTVQPDRA